MVAQTNEDQAAEVATAFNPAAELDDLVREAFGYFSAKMCAHKGYS
jgi:hypothetical protein